MLTGDNSKTARSLLLEDYVRKRIARSPTKRGNREAELEKSLIPRVADSPFGDFPPGYNVPRRTRSMSPRKRQTQSLSAEGAESMQKTRPRPLHKRTGFGGATSSLFKGKKPPKKPAPRAGAMERRPIPPTQFRRFYDRGDLQIHIDHSGSGNAIAFKVDPNKLDYKHYLPIFFDGLREKTEPYRFFAVEGTLHMINVADPTSKIVDIIPQLIIPIKTALNTRDPDIVCTVLKVLQQLLIVCEEDAGIALVPYFRQILPVFNLFKNSNANIGDKIEFGQRKRLNIGDLVEETLQLMELYGGEDAYINIKYMIPTYESCVLN